ncbi:MAG: fasciclin domain-containing protein [Pseudomonadota bacterium]
MHHFKTLLLAGATALALTTSAFADGHSKTVGGAAMLADKNIVENASQSADHTTLVAAVAAAGLVETLSSEGPFTVFAPVNSGFEALPAGTVETLLKPENKGTLTKVLTAHVVAGNVMAEDLLALIKKGHGYTNITTVSGDTITARVDGKGVYIFDESGGVSRVTIADVKQSNGVIHVVDNVLVPK